MLRYRERLTPSLWVLGSAAVLAPMAALVLTPFDSTVALIAGVVLGVVLIAALVLASPVIEVTDENLRAGRAHIALRYLGTPQTLIGPDAREARGPALDPHAWHLIRGGIDGLILLPIADERDPAPLWVLSSRTPDRLAAAILQARTRDTSTQALTD